MLIVSRAAAPAISAETTLLRVTFLTPPLISIVPLKL